MQTETDGDRGWLPDEPHAWRPEVLLIEDDDEMRALLAGVLRRDGFRVVTARDGYEALSMLGSILVDRRRSGVPDLIVTDQRMPGSDGLSVLEAARTMQIPSPVILITAFGDEEIHERVAGFPDATVLDKPFEMEDLLQQARRFLGLVA